MFKFFRPAFSESGNAMLTAMVASALVVGVAGTMFKSFSDTKGSFRAARVKSFMSTMELQIRRRALQPDAYQGCQVNTASCTVNNAFFSDLLTQPVYGAACPILGSECGVITRNIALDVATRTFRAEIAYVGQEVKPKPIQVVIQVPSELLQANSFHCGRIDPAKPIFTGFDPSTNRPICVGFNSCAAGEYLNGLNVSTRQLTCRPLPAAVSCGAQSLMSSFDWKGGAIEHTCAPLPEPPYSPDVNIVRNIATASTSTITNTSTSTATNTETTVVAETPTVWTWNGVLYSTTCTAGGCDAVEAASCSGPNCALSSISCYCVSPHGCHAPGAQQSATPTGFCY